MRNLVAYEWDWEENELPTLDGEVIEHWLSETPEPRPDNEGHYALCLVRSEIHPIDGDCDQEYLYVENGILPDEFNNGASVPKKCRKQFEIFINEGWLR